jgi:hypothetical protein
VLRAQVRSAQVVLESRVGKGIQDLPVSRTELYKWTLRNEAPRLEELSSKYRHRKLTHIIDPLHDEIQVWSAREQDQARHVSDLGGIDTEKITEESMREYEQTQAELMFIRRKLDSLQDRLLNAKQRYEELSRELPFIESEPPPAPDE